MYFDGSVNLLLEFALIWEVNGFYTLKFGETKLFVDSLKGLQSSKLIKYNLIFDFEISVYSLRLVIPSKVVLVLFNEEMRELELLFVVFIPKNPC